MQLRTETIQRWWPTTQSLDLVEGPVERVADALHRELARFLNGEAISASWEHFAYLDAAFSMAADFTNVPTLYLILPSRSRWTVLWNNSFLCDGYDSLCWCLTRNHGLTTIHWSAHDETTTFQPGAAFVYRRQSGGELVERIVQAAREDSRWSFYESGDALPEEDTAGYKARRKKDRLNERRVSVLLASLGASPWNEEFYAVQDLATYVVRRIETPETVIRRSRAEVLRRG